MAAAGNVSAMEMDGTVRLMVLALMKHRVLTWPFPPQIIPIPRDFVEKRLVSGRATGATRFKTLHGTGVLRVRVGERGRGLFAASHIKRGT
jgi:hypothetical protein